MTTMKKNNLRAYAFLSPFLILVTIFYMAPALITIVMSFTKMGNSFEWKFIGIKNYLRLFKDRNMVLVMWNTIKYVIICISSVLCIDLFFAILLHYFIKNDKISSFFKSILMIPMITPSVVYSVLWIWLIVASPNGILNQLLAKLFDAPAQNFIADHPFTIVICATLLTSFAYGTIIFSSAIKSIPETQIKAARVDGANDWSIIFEIILPNLRYHIGFIALWESLGLLTNYITILLITNGGPGLKTETWALAAYHKAFVDTQYGFGAAISVFLIVVVLLLMLIVLTLTRKKERSAANV